MWDLTEPNKAGTGSRVEKSSEYFYVIRSYAEVGMDLVINLG